jgi:16S rRNA (guanine(966)-N(2))-methyltransferase RsmD
MRIISGKFKGRRLQAPKKLPVRPTTDMAKEALFNILNNHYNLTQLKVLELFAGTGNISYEFASRGATPITCVDADYGCIAFIKKIATELDIDITAIKGDVFAFLDRNKASYDIIFADPPYHLSQQDFENISIKIFTNNLLDKEGMLIIEHSKDTKLAQMPYFSFAKSYGGTTFSFFEHEGVEDDDEHEETEN